MASKCPELDDPAWLRREYVERQRSMRAIGEQIGCAGATVSSALRRHGIVVDPPAREGPVDLRPVFSRQTPTPAGGCKCDRPLLGDDDLCAKCGR